MSDSILKMTIDEKAAEFEKAVSHIYNELKGISKIEFESEKIDVPESIKANKAIVERYTGNKDWFIDNFSKNYADKIFYTIAKHGINHMAIISYLKNLRGNGQYNLEEIFKIEMLVPKKRFLDDLLHRQVEHKVITLINAGDFTNDVTPIKKGSFKELVQWYISKTTKDPYENGVVVIAVENMRYALEEFKKNIHAKLHKLKATVD